MTAVVIPLPNIWGASPEDWNHFDVMLGLGEDLLPVVSNPHAEVSPDSKLKQLGKVPSVYTRDRKVVGIPKWTVHCSTQAEIDGWMTERDYGICVQTRRCRGIDIDVEDPVKASRLVAWFEKSIGQGVSKRVREGTGKCLIPVMVDGELAKTVIRVDGGTVEILGNGQQFIAVGTHPKGSRYQWEGGPFNKWPVMEPPAFREMLAEFAAAYAVEPITEGKLPSGAAPDLKGIDDPVAGWLEAQGLVLREEPRGLIVECPWHDEHSTGGEEAIWMPAGGRGKPEGHFRCLHAHCEGRTRREYLEAVGYVEDVASQFEDLGPEETDVPLAEMVEQHKAERFKTVSIGEFIQRPPMDWIIKKMIPKGAVGMIYGGSGDGKTFVALHLMLAIARGEPDWRGLKIRQQNVVYVVAEGASGFAQRLQAYAVHHQVDLADVPFRIIDNAPNLLLPADVTALISAIKVTERPGLIVVDTLAQVTPGGNENASEDMGLALAHAKRIHRETGAMVILIHHSGKDAARGARGWSGGKGAMDVQLEIVRGEDGTRAIHNEKQKDGRDGDKWGFRLHDVWLGLDADGDDITSCVVVPLEEGEDIPENGRQRAAGAKKTRKMRKPGAVEVAVLEALAELSLGGSGTVPAPFLIEAATTAVIAMDGSEAADGAKRYAARYKVNRAIRSLKDRGLLGNEGDLYFEVGGANT